MCVVCCLLCVVCPLLLDCCLLCVVYFAAAVCCVSLFCVLVNWCVLSFMRCGPVLLDVRCFCLLAIVRGLSRCRCLWSVVVCCLLLFDDARCLCLWLFRCCCLSYIVCVVGGVLLGVCCSLLGARYVLFVVRCWLSVFGCVLFYVFCLLCFVLSRVLV